jgi:hypothetical protein
MLTIYFKKPVNNIKVLMFHNYYLLVQNYMTNIELVR